MELKHTSGEWAAGIMMNTDGTKWLGVAMGDVKEGDTGVTILVSPEDSINEMDIANARLVSAAPDLLKCAVAMYYLYFKNGQSLTELKEAIEKATGLKAKEVMYEYARQEAERKDPNGI